VTSYSKPFKAKPHNKRSMDSFSLLQSVVPLIIAIIFTVISIKGMEELINERVHSVLAPIWCFLAGFTWMAYGIINVFGTTLDYFASFSYLYVGLGIIFFILMVVAVLLNFHLSSSEKRNKEMEMEVNAEPWGE
jgi:hypothetical protein